MDQLDLFQHGDGTRCADCDEPATHTAHGTYRKHTPPDDLEPRCYGAPGECEPWTRPDHWTDGHAQRQGCRHHANYYATAWCPLNMTHRHNPAHRYDTHPAAWVERTS